MARRRDRRIIRRFGGGLKATLRQKNTLTAEAHVWGGAAAGAESLIATAGDGTVVRGSSFSVHGVPGTYTVAEDSSTAGGKITLSFSPPLAGTAADQAAISFVKPYGEWTYPVMDGSGIAEVDKEVVGGRQIRVLAYQAGKPAPRQHGDELDGLPITGVDAVGNPPTRYRLTVTPP
jgi:hypothetical protein